jgi:cell wall-associated NlpC family hydrolase
MPPTTAVGDQVERAIDAAMSKLGAPYVWATAGPGTFDCSGFTWWVASQVLGELDYELRLSHHQFNVWGVPVTGPPRRGDLVFFDTMSVVIMGNRASHVGLALGDGGFIHAANEQLGVRLDRLDAAWYAPRFLGTRRIFLTPSAVRGGASHAG